MLRIFLFTKLILIHFLQSFQCFVEVFFSQIIICQRSIRLSKISRLGVFFHKSIQAFFRILLLQNHPNHIAEKQGSFFSGIAKTFVIKILLRIFVLGSIINFGTVEILCQTKMVVFFLCKILRLLCFGKSVER